jgi:hypothetical protein
MKRLLDGQIQNVQSFVEHFHAAVFEGGLGEGMEREILLSRFVSVIVYYEMDRGFLRSYLAA